MIDAERQRTALHEAAHASVAASYGWALGPVTIEPGQALAGCAIAAPPLVAVRAAVDWAAPFICWPDEVRRRVEGEAMMLAAGDVAELLFAPRSGRVPAPAAVSAAELIAGETTRGQLPGPTPAERAEMATACDDPALLSDADRLAQLARWTHPGPAAGGAWLGYVETQARALLLANERRVRRLAEALLASGTVGTQAAVRLLDQP